VAGCPSAGAMASACLDAINAPPGCNVVDAYCTTTYPQGYDCFGNVIYPEFPPTPNSTLWCTYQRSE
jgi:hypothetical protein